jgi:uncharacterized protein YegP (UPF0339 family)
MLEFIIFKDETEMYRWRLITPQGHVVAVAAEGFAREADLRAQLDLLRHKVHLAPAHYEDRMRVAEIPLI